MQVGSLQKELLKAAQELQLQGDVLGLVAEPVAALINGAEVLRKVQTMSCRLEGVILEGVCLEVRGFFVYGVDGYQK